MSKNWYPVIQYENCIECGACIEKCCKDVYEKNETKPNVIHPENCVEGCKGCQDVCPEEAVEFVGDTGEVSPCKCSGSCDCC